MTNKQAREAMNQMVETTKKSARVQFNWEDPFLLEQQLAEEERMIRDAAAAYCQDKLMPRVLEQFRHETTDPLFFVKWASWVCLGQPFLNNMAAQG
jgi:glutaryl-CoA dehydrogenase